MPIRSSIRATTKTESCSSRTLPRRAAANFAVRSLVSYVTEPLPWKGDSWFLRAYLPEHIVWWGLVVLLPFGVIAGLRLDPLLTMIFCGHAAMIVLVVALTSGNAGTLVRHRGLVLPYVVWLSALGGVAIARWMTPSLVAFDPDSERMAIVDQQGRLFGRLNLLDAAFVLLLFALIPLGYASWIVFRTPPAVLTSVEPATLMAEAVDSHRRPRSSICGRSCACRLGRDKVWTFSSAIRRSLKPSSPTWSRGSTT